MQIRSSFAIAVGAVSLTLALGACSREESPQADAAAIAAANVEPPPVEEPYSVEAVAGEESMTTNPDSGSATATPPQDPPSAAAEVPSETNSAPAAPVDAPDNSSIKATSFRGSGNEPFWNVEIDAGMANYKTLENQTGVMLQTKRSGDGNKVIYSGTHEGKPFSFTLVKRACSDSMSGRKFGYWLSATVDGQTNTGCADSR